MQNKSARDYRQTLRITPKPLGLPPDPRDYPPNPEDLQPFPLPTPICRKTLLKISGVYISLFEPPPKMGKKWPNNRLEGKRIEIKGEKKGREMHIFPPIDLKSAKIL